jgi:hypothetical protein
MAEAAYAERVLPAATLDRTRLAILADAQGRNPAPTTTISFSTSVRRRPTCSVASQSMPCWVGPSGLAPDDAGKMTMSEQKHPEGSERAISRWGPWWLRADLWPVLLLALLLMAGYFWEYCTPKVAIVALAHYHDFRLGSFLFGLVAGPEVSNW